MKWYVIECRKPFTSIWDHVVTVHPGYVYGWTFKRFLWLFTRRVKIIINAEEAESKARMSAVLKAYAWRHKFDPPRTTKIFECHKEYGDVIRDEIWHNGKR